ncbi:MAG TPA: hypothetical protein VF868_16240 [Bacteroidia bacterium]|jgi:hypothetical protein
MEKLILTAGLFLVFGVSLLGQTQVPDNDSLILKRKQNNIGDIKRTKSYGSCTTIAEIKTATPNPVKEKNIIVQQSDAIKND